MTVVKQTINSNVKHHLISHQIAHDNLKLGFVSVCTKCLILKYKLCWNWDEKGDLQRWGKNSKHWAYIIIYRQLISSLYIFIPRTPFFNSCGECFKTTLWRRALVGNKPWTYKVIRDRIEGEVTEGLVTE